MQIVFYIFLLCVGGFFYNNIGLFYPQSLKPTVVPTASITSPTQPYNQRQIVEMYSLTTCGHCTNMAKAMAAAGIQFSRYDIDKYPQRMTELNQRMISAGYRPGGGVPILFVGSHMFMGEVPISQIMAVSQ